MTTALSIERAAAEQIGPKTTDETIELAETIISTRSEGCFRLVAIYRYPDRPPLGNFAKMTHVNRGTLAECLAAQAELHAQYWPQPIV